MRATLRLRKPSFGTFLGAVALLVATTGMAVASVPRSDGSVPACYHSKTGVLRVIDVDAGQGCTPAERPLRIASTDANGKVANADKLDGLDGSAYRLTCASGDVLFLGLCFELTTRTADSHSDAQRDCGGDGRRLPSEGELRALRDSDVDVTLASSEWTDELSDTDVAGSFLYAVVGTSGSGVDESIENYPYRCVGGPTG